jgi:GntR family transcriptional repressor for pyruvate dehydrogenase complex
MPKRLHDSSATSGRPPGASDHRVTAALPDGVLRPILASHAFEEVVDQVAHAIRAGHLSCGDRLPRISELAAAMHVSQPTVGAAVRVLANAGVLDVKRGASGGVWVRSTVIPPGVLRLTSQRRARGFNDLVEARRPIELALARLAVVRATEEDLAEMRRACELLEHSVGRTDDWVDANYTFHYALGRAAHSELLAFFQIEAVKELALLLTDDWTPRDISDPQATIREHRAILEALERRDAEAVGRAVKQHLAELELLATPLHPPQRS